MTERERRLLVSNGPFAVCRDGYGFRVTISARAEAWMFGVRGEAEDLARAIQRALNAARNVGK